MSEPSRVVRLAHADAAAPQCSGAKAANLARAAVAGLPVLPGFVLTTEAVAAGLDDPAVLAALRPAWEELAAAGAPLVVRSSSTIEDAGTSSMAGRFTSVLDVVGWDAFVAATRRVVASADAVRDADGVSRPMAVLVQRQLDAALGGVLFGIDPVTGDRHHVVVEAVASGPDALVSGRVTADHYVLSRRGRVLQHRSAGTPVPLAPLLRWRLARLAVRAGRAFGGPQDVEWAVDRAGTLWLLQTRPVTAAGDGGRGPLLGPGPVAETFPEPLDPLEDDLWVAPLRDGIERALRATGVVSDAKLAHSPIVTTVDGRAAVDLELLGLTTGRTPLRRRMSPVAIGRRLAAAWRVGRLRVGLPALGASVVATVDRDLAAIPRLDELTSADLIELLDRTGAELRVVHTYEVLSGMLLRRGEPAGPAVSATLVALRAVHEGRAAGRADADIVRREPAVLALAPPSLRRDFRLPPTVPALPGGGRPGAGCGVDDLDLRDGLRLRARWLQELGARVARRLGQHLAADGVVDDPAAVAVLRLAELHDLVAGGPAPADLDGRLRRRPGPPLPAVFRLGTGGAVRADHAGPTPVATGLPAGGGRASGEVRHEVPPGTPRGGLVLVTRNLEPQLATVLPSLDGLVAETGSALSHLAILARELGVATVVAVDGAVERFPPGTQLSVDGASGAICVLGALDQSREDVSKQEVPA